jgi:exoribonuclease R
MLPERLSTDLTSLGLGEDRMAVVVETAVDRDGGTGVSSVYRAVVRNQPTATDVGAWLEGKGELLTVALPSLSDLASRTVALRLKMHPGAGRWARDDPRWPSSVGILMSRQSRGATGRRRSSRTS